MAAFPFNLWHREYRRNTLLRRWKGKWERRLQVRGGRGGPFRRRGLGGPGPGAAGLRARGCGRCAQRTAGGECRVQRPPVSTASAQSPSRRDLPDWWRGETLAAQRLRRAGSARGPAELPGSLSRSRWASRGAERRVGAETDVGAGGRLGGPGRPGFSVERAVHLAACGLRRGAAPAADGRADWREGSATDRGTGGTRRRDRRREWPRGLGAPPRDGVNGAARGREVGGGGCEDSRSRAPGRRNTGARQGPFPPFLRFPTIPVDAEPAVGLERRLRVAVPREVSRPGLGPTPRWRSRGAVLELSCARAAARTPRTAHRRPQAGTPTTSLLTRRPARGWEREGCISVWGGGDSRLSAVGLGLAAEEPGLRGFPASRVRDFSTVEPVEARVGGYPPASSGRSRGATEAVFLQDPVESSRKHSEGQSVGGPNSAFCP
nr:uncharacterized protein LOC103221007 [Chlorocebus sabaeus]